MPWFTNPTVAARPVQDIRAKHAWGSVLTDHHSPGRADKQRRTGRVAERSRTWWVVRDPDAGKHGWPDSRAVGRSSCMPAVIETDRLTKRYGGSRGIEDVSIGVEEGEVYGFLGPNGAGKPTTIRTLLDLLHPTSGSAQLFGLDSRRESHEIRARLGNLPGDFACDPGLTTWSSPSRRLRRYP